MGPPQAVTTSYLLENLHCPSCVALIKSQLCETYGSEVIWVSPNLVTSVVTVEHHDSKKTLVRSMKKTLEDVGFQVCGMDTTASVANDSSEVSNEDIGESSQSAAHPRSAASRWSRFWLERSPTPDLEAAQAAHLENCEACRSPAHGKDSALDEKQRLAVSESFQIPKDKQDDSDAFQGVVTGHGEAPLMRATLAIEGMTCAVCSNTITDELQKIPWISRIVVSLVTNSATVDFNDPDRAKDVVETIEDLGYDAIIDNVVNLNEISKSDDWREVQIKIDGMFCPRCPERLVNSLSLLGSDRLEISDQPSIRRPLMKLKYKPEVPDFTIRQILQTITATDVSLEPAIFHPPTLEERSRAIRAKHQRSLWWREIMTFILAIPTFVFGIVYMGLMPDTNPVKHFLMKPWTSGVSRLDVMLCLLATPIWLFAADIFHKRALKEMRSMWRRGSTVPIAARFYKFGSMNMLMSLGTTVAYVSSVAQMFAIAAAGKQKPSSDGLIYFDSVVFLTLFLLAGRLIESYSKSKAGNAVEMLAKLRPDTAILVEEDKLQGRTTRKIPLDQLERGDVILVPNGASPPADGLILVGQTSVDESSLTGESKLVKKGKGDEIYAGTINQSASVTARVTSIEGRSMLDQIVDVVREGQTKRAPVERIADILTSYFVPLIVLIAMITWIVWLSLGLSGVVTDQHFDSAGEWVSFALRFAIAVFVVACPCGIGLAAPTAIFVGGGLAAKYGILAKGGGEAFEKAHKVDAIVFDKTGTLTVGGDPQITDFAVMPEGLPESVSEPTLWSALKGLEENSSHPIASAIVGFCGTKSVSTIIEDPEELPGKGMKATCRRDGQGGLEIAVGNEALMDDLSISVSEPVASQLETWKTEAKSVALVAVRSPTTDAWSLAATLAISDAIREETAPVLKSLQAKGVQVWMLSGDNVTTAKAVAQKVGIPAENVLAQVLPSEKADKIKYLQTALPSTNGEGRAMVAMVGDGINDSPALTAADVGIAIGSGSDVAISSADFVLATSNLGAVLTLLDLSRTVFRRIKFNFGWAVVYNLVAIPFAAGCFYPLKTAGGDRVMLPPEFAALAMALSSISVVLSSLSLRSGLPVVGFETRVLYND